MLQPKEKLRASSQMTQCHPELVVVSTCPSLSLLCYFLHSSGLTQSLLTEQDVDTWRRERILHCTRTPLSGMPMRLLKTHWPIIEIATLSFQWGCCQGLSCCQYPGHFFFPSCCEKKPGQKRRTSPHSLWPCIWNQMYCLHMFHSFIIFRLENEFFYVLQRIVCPSKLLSLHL